MFELAEALQSSSLSVAIQSRLWLTPLLQSIHIVMIGVVFVSILMVALKVLGRAHAEEPIADILDRYAPWMWSALGVMALTGVILIVGEPVREASALSFWLKMALLAIGIGSAAVFERSLKTAGADANHEFPTAAKAVAVGTPILWLAIIFLGRAIAYDVEVWGSLHLG